VVSIRLALGQLGGTGEISWDERARTLAIEYRPAEVTVPAVQNALAVAGYVTTVVR
jgi:hypothetical protein